MVGFTSYSLENDKVFKRNLNKAIAAVDDLRFAMGEISRDIFKTTKQNFILKTTGKYPPLSPQYAKYKEKVKPNLPILVFSGRLRDSVTNNGNKDTIRIIGKKSLVQGTRVPYGRYVQEGTSKMPERKFLFIDNAQSLRIERILADYVSSKLEVLGNVS